MSENILYAVAPKIFGKGILWMSRGTKISGKVHHLPNSNPAPKKGKVMETQNDKTMFKQIAMLLIQADKFVKEGRLSEALEKIAEARTFDPAHLYAIAYEERVKALLHTHQKSEAHNARAHENVIRPCAIQSSNGNSANPEIRNGNDISPDPGLAPVPPKEPSASRPADNGQHGAAMIAEPPARNLEKNIAAILSQAYHFHLRKEYNRALDEIARIYLFAPSHARARALEATIRSAIQGQNVEHVVPKAETLPPQVREKTPEPNITEDTRRTAIGKKMYEIVARISTFVKQKQYKRALDELARGFILDPDNPQLNMLEEKIRDEEQRNIQHHNPVATVTVIKENGKVHDRSAKISQCFIRANELLRINKLEDALNELALAVIIDPFNEEAIKMEKTIIDAQHRQLEERRKTCKEIAAMIAA